jgi:hypothetical protein
VIPSPEEARQLVDLGSTVMLVFLVILIFVGLFREWWVPGWLYRRERTAREIADTQAERNATSLAAIAKALERERRRRVSGTSNDPA